MYEGISPRDLYKLNEESLLEVNRTYEANLWDCEDFVRACTHKAKREHKGSYSLAVGRAHYFTRRGVYHAINIVFDIDGRLYYFEPQSSKEVKLTPEEINSIGFIMI